MKGEDKYRVCLPDPPEAKNLSIYIDKDPASLRLRCEVAGCNNRRNSMKTIAVRAVTFRRHPIEHNNGALWESGYREGCSTGYIKGATEQRKIDIRLMRQWLEREYAYNGSMAVITPDMIDEICKAMEE